MKHSVALSFLALMIGACTSDAVPDGDASKTTSETAMRVPANPVETTEPTGERTDTATSPQSRDSSSSNRVGTAAGTAKFTTEVPARFQGVYALDRRACAEDYNYSPAFQNVRINARRVSFFETGGPVTSVETEGDAIAITFRHQVADSETRQTIYFALQEDGTARYRSGLSDPSQIFVRCR